MTLEPLLDGFPEEGTIFPVASVHLAVSGRIITATSMPRLSLPVEAYLLR